MIPGREPGGIHHFPSQESWSLQESRTRTGIAQHSAASAKAEIQSPILLSQLKGSPCCAQQEFHSWSQKLDHGFASQCFCYFCRIVLQLTGSWYLVCDLLNLCGQVLTRSSAAGNAAPPKSCVLGVLITRWNLSPLQISWSMSTQA